jgi:thiol reductant ABC exporter CydD subunit
MIRRLFQHQPRAVWLLALSIGLGFIGGILIIVQAVYLAEIVNGAFLGRMDFNALTPLLVVLAGWILLRMVVHAAFETVSAQMALRLKGELRKKLVRHLRSLGPAYVQRERTGELVNTVYEGIEQLEIYVAKYVPQMALSMLLPLAVLVLVAGVDVVTALILAGTFPLLILFMILIGKTAKAVTERQWRMLSLLSGHFLDVVRGLVTLKVFNRSQAQWTIIARMSEQHRRTTMGTLRIAFLSAFVMELFTTISTALIAVFLGLRLISGDIDFEQAFLVLLLAPEFYLPVRALGTQFHAGTNGVVAAERIFRILDTVPLGWPDQPAGEQPAPMQGGYRITFNNVGFTYPGESKPAVSELTFTIEPGEHVALLGPSGAGKSTILALMLGFVRPTVGEIYVNGVDMSRISLRWWRAQLAAVPQHTHLFQGTIADNIRLGHPAASAEAVHAAAAKAQAQSFIEALPEQYETPLGESVTLSGGQMSRIVLARAYLLPAPILLMDEPTAQLDMETEAAVHQALEQMLSQQQRTLVLVTHRLGLAQLAQKIIVIQHGKMTEMGSKEQLLQQQGLYAQLVHAYDVKTNFTVQRREREMVAG